MFSNYLEKYHLESLRFEFTIAQVLGTRVPYAGKAEVETFPRGKDPENKNNNSHSHLLSITNLENNNKTRTKPQS